MPIVQHDMLRSLCFEIFKATGIPKEDADIISTHLVDSHLAGHDSHGTWLLPGLCTGNEAQVHSVGRTQGSSRESVSAGN